MYIDDIKLFDKNKKDLETLMHAMRIYSQDIWMKFGIEKCAMLMRRSRKRHIIEVIEISNPEIIRIIEVDTIKRVEMKEKNKKTIISRKQ